MDALNWRKASYSASNGGCVEVAGHEGMVLVRDTKDHGRGPVHRFTRAGWEAFTAGVRAGEFDLDESGCLP
jgi:predicted secreted Zn-dependent protease